MHATEYGHMTYAWTWMAPKGGWLSWDVDGVEQADLANLSYHAH